MGANVVAARRLNFALAHYNPDGHFDGAFNSDGIVTTAMASGDNVDVVSGIAMDANGKIVAGGLSIREVSSSISRSPAITRTARSMPPSVPAER